MTIRKEFSDILGLIIIVAVTFILCIFNVHGLDIGRDEGVHAYAAKTLAFEGKYALKNGSDFLEFDRRIAVGPTVIIPTAWAYRTFGFSVAVTRIVPAVYFLLFILFFFILIRRLYGNSVAFLTCLLVLSAQWPSMRELALFNPIYRTLTGESAALFFLVLSLLFWEKKYLSAFILGLAILTKYQFALALVPLLLVRSGFLTRRVGNSLTLRAIFDVSLLTVASFTPLFLWFAYQYFNLGQQGFLNQLGTYQNFSNQTFDLSFIRIKQNIVDKWMELNPTALKVFFTLPAIIFGWVYTIRGKLHKEGLKLFLILFPTVWMVWYVFSRGYIRYEIPGLYFAVIFLSMFFVQCGFPTRRVEGTLTLTLRVFIITLLLSILLYGFYINFRESKIMEPKNSENMALYINNNVLPSAKVITSELDYDIDLFLSSRVLYHTAAGVRDVASKGKYPEIPLDVKYILSKNNDPTFEKALENPIWQPVYKAGDWYLYGK